MESLSQFRPYAIEQQVGDAAVAFQSPIFVRVCGNQFGKVVHRDTISGNQTLVGHLAQENAGNLTGGWVVEFDSGQEVSLESNLTGQNTLQLEGTSGQDNKRVSRWQGASNLAKGSTTVITSSRASSTWQQGVTLVQYQDTSLGSCQNLARFLDGSGLALAVDQVVTSDAHEILCLDHTNLVQDIRKDGSDRSLSNTGISLEDNVTGVGQLSVGRGFDQFHRSAHSTNLVFDGLESDKFAQGNFHGIIGRTQGILNELGLLFVFVAGSVTVSSGASTIGSGGLSDLEFKIQTNQLSE